MENIAILSYSRTPSSKFPLKMDCCDVFVINTNDKNKYLSNMSSYNDGSKWENILWFLENMAFWDEYDYMWFPDENIEITEDNIKKYLELVNKKNMLISQPSVDWACKKLAHKVLLNEKKNIFRRSTFVGINAPCFEVNFVKNTLLPFLQENREHLKSGWGVDIWWSNVMKNDLYIVDEVTMKITSSPSEEMKVGMNEKKYFVEKYKLNSKI